MSPLPAAYRHVLVPLDGSPASEEALPHAAAIALRTGASVSLVHVRVDTDPADRLPEAYPASLRGDPRLPAKVELHAAVLSGTVPEALLSHATATGADLIVMTSSGRGGVSRALFGSVADAIIRRAEIPVMIARSRPQPPAADPRTFAPSFRRVLLPLDGSEVAERIVPFALALTGTGGVHYVVLRVRPAVTPDGRLEPGPILARPSDPAPDGYLSSVAARIAAHEVLVSERAITHASTADVVVKLADEEDVDLIAMTTRGAGGADRLLFGSVADEVLRRASCSVLVVRPASDA